MKHEKNSLFRPKKGMSNNTCSSKIDFIASHSSAFCTHGVNSLLPFPFYCFPDSRRVFFSEKTRTIIWHSRSFVFYTSFIFMFFTVLEAADLGKEVFMFHADLSREKTKLTTWPLLLSTKSTCFSDLGFHFLNTFSWWTKRMSLDHSKYILNFVIFV